MLCRDFEWLKPQDWLPVAETAPFFHTQSVLQQGWQESFEEDVEKQDAKQNGHA